MGHFPPWCCSWCSVTVATPNHRIEPQQPHRLQHLQSCYTQQELVHTLILVVLMQFAALHFQSKQHKLVRLRVETNLNPDYRTHMILRFTRLMIGH